MPCAMERRFEHRSTKKIRRLKQQLLPDRLRQIHRRDHLAAPRHFDVQRRLHSLKPNYRIKPRSLPHQRNTSCESPTGQGNGQLNDT
jgi:hypothetical protein